LFDGIGTGGRPSGEETARARDEGLACVTLAETAKENVAIHKRSPFTSPVSPLDKYETARYMA
jgi:hypothetical protein